MGRRKGSVNKVDITSLPKGVSFFADGRARPFSVFHKGNKREFFATAEEAVARKKELVATERIHGSAALEYDRKTHVEVLQVREILPPGVSIVDCARFWVKHHPSGSSPMVATAVKMFIESKRKSSITDDDDCDNRHIRDIKSRLGAFALAFGDQLVSEVSADAALSWLLSLDKGPRTVMNYRNHLQNFFNFAVRKQWCGVSPMNFVSVQDLPRVGSSDKHPLAVDQANDLLEFIKNEAPVYLAHFALRIFLGFRTSEARRFRWEWIQPEQGRVYIPDFATKTGDAWSIDDIPPRFWDFVKKPTETGLVPAPYVRIWQGCKEVKGIRSAQVGLKHRILKRIGLMSWPSNATRDTFCTLHISAYRDPQRTALVLKHRNSQTLWQSYLGALVPRAKAIDFFEKKAATIKLEPL